jgi:hypothetical protein
VGQHERSALLNGQLKKRALQLIAIEELAESILDGRLVDREDRDLERPPSAAPDLVVTGVDEKAVQPGLEPIGFPKPAKIAPRPDECVLNGILRGIPVAKDSPRDRVQAVVCGGREGIECLVVAPLCALDELGRHGRSPF